MSTTVIPDYTRSWDSMEGVPEFGPLPPAQASGSAFNRAGHLALTWVGERLPGLVLAAALAYLAIAVAGASWWTRLGFAQPPIGGTPLAIILGIVICNTIGVPEIFRKGMRTCMVQLLRLAIILLGLRLSLAAAGTIGYGALPVVIVCVASALLIVPWLAERVGLSRRLGTLIAVGTSICGVSAIMAAAPTIGAKEDEVTYAVGCVALFGVLAMLFYPWMAPWVFGMAPRDIGIFLGTAIHDTTQVTAAAFAFQQVHAAPEVLNSATVVKILRNLTMVAVIPLMAVLYHRTTPNRQDLLRRWHHVVPLFVLGFVAMTLVRTIGDASPRPFGLLAPETWRAWLAAANVASIALLTVVMAAVGLNTNLSQLRRLGARPFLAGLLAAVLVGVVSVAAIKATALLR